MLSQREVRNACSLTSYGTETRTRGSNPLNLPKSDCRFWIWLRHDGSPCCHIGLRETEHRVSNRTTRMSSLELQTRACVAMRHLGSNRSRRFSPTRRSILHLLHLRSGDRLRIPSFNFQPRLSRRLTKPAQSLLNLTPNSAPFMSFAWCETFSSTVAEMQRRTSSTNSRHVDRPESCMF